VFRSHPWLGPVARHRLVTTPNYLHAVEVLLDTVRQAGYGPRAAAEVVDYAIDSVSAMATRLAARPKDPRVPSEEQLEMRERLLDLSGEDYRRIRAAAKALTSPENPATYVKRGIDILIGGIEAAAPKSSSPAARG
jgi:TetR/AcrR family transcriptional regulator, tetracycline repressor protein